jgi:predicted helicase
MYSRFYRWASDRLDKNGIIAFITNSSFLDSKTFDGFRKMVSDEFSHIYIVDLGGNIRKNPKLSGPTHNVFAIQTGVAIAFFVKEEKKSKTPAQIFYTRRDEMELATEKLGYLRNAKFEEIKFESIKPDKNNNWLDIIDSDWDKFIPVSIKNAGLNKSHNESKSIFNFSSPGINTARDEWVYDFDKNNLTEKIKFLIKRYNQQRDYVLEHPKEDPVDSLDYSIKWSANLISSLLRQASIEFNNDLSVSALYRPYIQMWYYSSKDLSDRLTSKHFEIYGQSLHKNNLILCISGKSSTKKFQTLITDRPVGFDSLEKTQCLPLYRYAEDGTRVENITDWALSQFQKQYK